MNYSVTLLLFDGLVASSLGEILKGSVYLNRVSHAVGRTFWFTLPTTNVLEVTTR